MHDRAVPMQEIDLPLEKPLAIADKIAADEKLPSLPTLPPSGDSKTAGSGAATSTKNDAEAQEDEFTLLAKRFEALKKK